MCVPVSEFERVRKIVQILAEHGIAIILETCVGDWMCILERILLRNKVYIWR